jgi:hypothetical protein
MNDEYVDRKRIAITALASCLLFFVFTGCGKKQPEQSVITFDKEGHILEYLVEDFPASQYDETEWESEVKKGIDAYNKSGKGTIALSEVSLSDDVLRCLVDYDTDDSYFYLNNEPIFYGTVDQAYRAGYNMMIPLYDTKSKDALPAVRLNEMGESHIVIMDRQIDVRTYSKIRYASDNVTIDDDLKGAKITGDNTAYIVFD